MGWLDGEKDDGAMTVKDAMKSKIKEIGKEAAYTYKDELFKTDNFMLYRYVRVYYTGRSRPGDMGSREYESYKDSSVVIEPLNDAIKYCIRVHFDNYKMVVKFKIAYRRDSVESLKSYSECLKDAVKFAKEMDKMIYETR